MLQLPGAEEDDGLRQRSPLLLDLPEQMAQSEVADGPVRRGRVPDVPRSWPVPPGAGRRPGTVGPAVQVPARDGHRQRLPLDRAVP